MLEDVYTKINDLITDGEIINNNCFQEITKILIEYYRLEKFIDSITFNNDEFVANYSPKEHLININDNYLEKIIDKEYGKIKSKVSKEFYNRLYILRQLIVYFHEIKHVLQRKLIYTAQYDSRNMIMVIVFIKSMEALSLEKGELYRKYGYLFPFERDANVFGYSMALDIFSQNKNIQDDFLKVLLSSYYKLLIDGYNNDFTKGNFNRFFEQIRKESEGELLKESIKFLNFKEKLMIGCPLAKFEIPWFNDFNDYDDNYRDVLKKKIIL